MQFEPGSILKRRLGGWYGQVYYHMGVYVGDGMVVHFNGEKQKQATRSCARTRWRCSPTASR